MKYIFLSVAIAAAMGTSAQSSSTPSNNMNEAERIDKLRIAAENQRLNRASQWSKESASEARNIDTSKLVKKTITQEISLPKALDVLIDMSGELVINTWKENKMKIETTFQHDESIVLTDSQWLERTGIGMKVFGSTVKVKSRAGTGITYFGNGVTTLLSSSTPFTYYNGGNIFNIPRSTVTLYLPAESILEIESKSGRLKIRDNIKSLVLDNSDGQIEFANIEKLQLRSNRGSFSGGIVGEADIELSHGRFALKQLNKGMIKSDYSTIEIEGLKELKLNSSNDEIDIDNVASLYGIKKYGNLRINQLTAKLDLQGINSDIKLRHIEPSTQLVKISNRNADLRLSTDKISNFTVDIKGSYNTIYSSFAENMTADTLTAAEIETVKTLTATPAQNVKITGTGGGTYNLYNSGTGVAITTSPLNNANTITTTSARNAWMKQAAKAGSGNNPTKYEVTCISCVIDFK